MRQRGLTLIEVLAATVLLGVLALALVPLQSRIATRHLLSEQRLSAREAVRVAMADPGFTWAEGQRMVPGHEGWQVVVTRLPPPADPTLVIIPHEWWTIRLTDTATGTVLADILAAQPVDPATLPNPGAR